MADALMNELRVFRLSPVQDQYDSHHWLASRHKGESIIVAKDAARARAIARRNFFIAAAITAQGVPANPWGQSGIVSCVEIQDNNIRKETEHLVTPEGFDDKRDE